MVETLQGDPCNLVRFVSAQRDSFDSALSEVKKGRKLSHWMWYIFPQIRGLGRSATSRRYGISGVDEACAYLNHEMLGSRLVKICDALMQLKGRSATDIFGKPDDIKLRSSMTLFSHVSAGNSIFHKVINKYFDGSYDRRTLQLLGE